MQVSRENLLEGYGNYFLWETPELTIKISVNMKFVIKMSIWQLTGSGKDLKRLDTRIWLNNDIDIVENN